MSAAEDAEYSLPAELKTVPHPATPIARNLNNRAARLQMLGFD